MSTLKMSKLTTTRLKLTELIEELTGLWIDWMQHHNNCNTPSTPINIRRQHGEECENLQKRRQQILIEINEEFDKLIN